MPGPVIEALRRNWWTFIFRGVCAIAFGFFAWFWPGMTLLALLLTWGVMACVNGVVTLASARLPSNAAAPVSGMKEPMPPHSAAIAYNA